MPESRDPQPRTSTPAGPDEGAAPAEFDPGTLYRAEDEDTPIVCHCMVVHEETLRRAIEHGAVDFTRLSEWTHAGLGCGTCRFDLEEMLAEAERPAPEGGANPANRDRPPAS